MKKHILIMGLLLLVVAQIPTNAEAISGGAAAGIGVVAGLLGIGIGMEASDCCGGCHHHGCCNHCSAD